MSKILVTPVHEGKLYIDFDTKMEFPSGKIVETDETSFVKAKQRMGHLRLATEEEAKEFEATRPTASPETLEQFLALSADEQKQKLVELGKAADVNDEAISNKDKREALYAEVLNGAGE